MFDLPEVTTDNNTQYTPQEPVTMPPLEPEVVPAEEVTNENPPVDVPDEEKKTEVEPEVSPEAVVEPAQEDLSVPQVESTEPVQPTGPNASFNCPDCKGSGLIVNNSFAQGKICEGCGGTGKI